MADGSAVAAVSAASASLSIGSPAVAVWEATVWAEMIVAGAEAAAVAPAVAVLTFSVDCAGCVAWLSAFAVRFRTAAKESLAPSSALFTDDFVDALEATGAEGGGRAAASVTQASNNVRVPGGLMARRACKTPATCEPLTFAAECAGKSGLMSLTTRTRRGRTRQVWLGSPAESAALRMVRVRLIAVVN